MKILILILAILNGGYMLTDGIYVMLNGKYIGPEEPGPWALLFRSMGINVFKLGPMFIAFGVLWLLWLYMFLSQSVYASTTGIALSILTLWYLPVGTIFSLIVLAGLWMSK